MTGDDQAVSKRQDLADHSAGLISIVDHHDVDAGVDTHDLESQVGHAGQGVVQYARSAALPMMTPLLSGTTRAATGEVNTTSSAKARERLRGRDR